MAQARGPKDHINRRILHSGSQAGGIPETRVCRTPIYIIYHQPYYDTKPCIVRIKYSVLCAVYVAFGAPTESRLNAWGLQSSSPAEAQTSGSQTTMRSSLRHSVKACKGLGLSDALSLSLLPLLCISVSLSSFCSLSLSLSPSVCLSFCLYTALLMATAEFPLSPTHQAIMSLMGRQTITEGRDADQKSQGTGRPCETKLNRALRWCRFRIYTWSAHGLGATVGW